MFHYRIHGRPVSCQWPLALPEDVIQDETNSFLITENKNLRTSELKNWKQLFSSEGEPVARLAAQGDDWVLDCNGEVNFLIGKNRIEMGPSQISIEDLSSMLVSQILPMALSRSSDLMVHASALCFESRVWAFMGPEGCGKSTLAGYFREQGATFVSDDALRLKFTKNAEEPVLVYPGAPEIRLFPATINNIIKEPKALLTSRALHKRRLSVTDGIQEPKPLAGIFCLCPSEKITKVSVEPASKAESLHMVFNNLFRVSTDSEELIKKEFFAVTNLVEKVKFYKLFYPFDWKFLPELGAAVKSVVEGR